MLRRLYFLSFFFTTNKMKQTCLLTNFVKKKSILNHFNFNIRNLFKKKCVMPRLENNILEFKK